MLHCGFEQFLILCLELFQLDFKFNEDLKINNCVCVGGGGVLPLNGNVWVILGSH